MKYFVGVDPEDFVCMQCECVDDEPPGAVEDVAFHEVPELNYGAGKPTRTSRLKWIEGVWSWLETASVAELRTAAILQVDGFADSCRLAVVGDAARIKEYEDAQLGAEQYRDAGFSGPVPAPVAAWAYAKRRENWTAQQAAEDILAASARWYTALRGIRALRLDAKESIRAAITEQEVAATAATFRATLTAAMEGVQ